MWQPILESGGAHRMVLGPTPNFFRRKDLVAVQRFAGRGAHGARRGKNAPGWGPKKGGGGRRWTARPRSAGRRIKWTGGWLAGTACRSARVRNALHRVDADA